MQDPKDRPKVPFDQIQPGDAIGPFSYDLSEELVDRHLRATDQEGYPDSSLAPISLLAADGVQLADRFFDISQSVHAGQRLRVHRVPRVGERLTLRGEARDKFVKRGRRYVVTDTFTSDERGGLVARGTTTGVVVYGEGAGREDGGKSTGPTSLPRAEPAVVERIGPLVRTMTLEKMRLYEPPGELSIHTDDAFARGVGLPAAIATGTLFLSYLFDLLYRSYGPGSLVGTELDVRIRLPVFAGDRIEAFADRLSEEGPVEHAVQCRVERGAAIVGRFGRLDSRLRAFVADRYETLMISRDTTRWYQDLYSAPNRGGWERTKAHIRTMKERSDAQDAGFAVMLWPLLVGLDGDYPFGEAHERIARVCRRNGITFLDLLDTLRGRSSESLWAHPADLHPNELGHLLAAEALAPLVEALLD